MKAEPKTTSVEGFFLFTSRQHVRRHTLTSTQPPTEESDFPKNKAIPRFGGHERDHSALFSGKQNNSRGFTLAELIMTLLVGTVLTAMAIPVMNSAITTMRMNSTVSAITAAISQTRYRAIMNSQLYTLVLTTPNNTYVVTNANTNTADAPVPLPNQAIALNGGANATYTFTLCPNGTVYGAGGTCPGNNLPPALTATYYGRQTNINISNVGNVNATIIH